MSGNSDFLETGLLAAKSAGEVIKHYSDVKLDVRFKRSKDDFVTMADIETEKTIIKVIKDKFPDHIILGEETNITAGSSDMVWVVDPIDGTFNFYYKIPYFSVSIGLLKGTKPLMGIVYNPITNQLFHAINGKSWLNNELIKTSSVSNLNNALVYVSENNKVELRQALKTLLQYFPAKKVEEKKSTALALAHTALGQASAYFKLSIKNWDVIAGHYITECSGCKVTDNYGNKLSYDYTEHINPNGIIAANPKLHKQILQFLLENREKALSQTL